MMKRGHFDKNKKVNELKNTKCEHQANDWVHFVKFGVAGNIEIPFRKFFIRNSACYLVIDE